MSWIQTYSRRKFDLLAARPEDVLIVDIARGLSCTGRFTGQTDFFYSVAQHSVLVSQHCEPQDALWGLLHDAAEAYLCDLPRPLKQLLPEYEQIERRLQMVIATQFKLIGRDTNEFLRTFERVKELDKRLIATEWRDLMGGLMAEATVRLSPPFKERIIPWSPEVARETFLDRFEELLAARRGEVPPETWDGSIQGVVP